MPARAARSRSWPPRLLGCISEIRSVNSPLKQTLQRLGPFDVRPISPQLKRTLQRLGPFIALLIVCVGLALLSPDFLTVSNLFDVMRQVSINAVIAFGMTLAILLGGIDLSVGSILAVSSVLIALMLKAGITAGLAAPVGLLAGAAMGAVNGLVITKGRVAPFIATLGMMTLLRGVALVISQGSPISGFSSDFFSMVGGGYLAGLVQR